MVMEMNDSIIPNPISNATDTLFQPFSPSPHFHLLPCAFLGCNFNSMPLSSFCHFHILSDSNQKLYKPCNYVIKSAQAGPITCGKPILRSTVAALCIVHSQKHLPRTLKRNGLNISSTSKMAPKFHVMVTEYVHLVQTRRKELRGNKSKFVVQKENDDRAQWNRIYDDMKVYARKNTRGKMYFEMPFN